MSRAGLLLVAVALGACATGPSALAASAPTTPTRLAKNGVGTTTPYLNDLVDDDLDVIGYDLEFTLSRHLPTSSIHVTVGGVKGVTNNANVLEGGRTEYDGEGQGPHFRADHRYTVVIHYCEKLRLHGAVRKVCQTYRRKLVLHDG
jgi:hypothetical protein